MLTALLLAATAVPAGAAQAERAFTAKAQRDGQWTAFRAFADADALMFVPEPANAQGWLAGRADPAIAITRSAARIFTACDDSLAVSTGPWMQGTAHGTFTTVWRHQRDGGWKWLFDHRRDTPYASPARKSAEVSAPSCGKGEAAALHPPEGVHLKGALLDAALLLTAFGAGDMIVQRDGMVPAQDGAGLPRVKVGQPIARGCSDDGSLCWESVAIDGGQSGAHDLIAYQRRDGASKIVLYDLAGVAAP
jgi:hypothetical protein